MLLVHISSDQVLFAWENLHEILPYQDLERTFPKRFLELVKTCNVSKIAVINGPGSFTSLRIGTLCINMYNKLCDIDAKNEDENKKQKRLKLLDIPKIHIINYAQSLWFLPMKSIVFMWMRKKMWANNWTEEPIEITKETVQDFIDGDEYVVDWVSDHPVVEELDKNKFLSHFEYTKEWLQITYWKAHFIVEREKIGTWVDEIEPRYMMEPILN